MLSEVTAQTFAEVLICLKLLCWKSLVLNVSFYAQELQRFEWSMHEPWLRAEPGAQY